MRSTVGNSCKTFEFYKTYCWKRKNIRACYKRLVVCCRLLLLLSAAVCCCCLLLFPEAQGEPKLNPGEPFANPTGSCSFTRGNPPNLILICFQNHCSQIVIDVDPFLDVAVCYCCCLLLSAAAVCCCLLSAVAAAVCCCLLLLSAAVS